MHPATIVDGWLSRITYKPDTQFEVARVDPQEYARLYGVRVVAKRNLPDSTKGITNLAEYADYVGFIPIAGQEVVPWNIVEREDFTAFLRWFRHWLRRMEQHEMDEWLRVDGELPFDPHKEN